MFLHDHLSDLVSRHDHLSDRLLLELILEMTTANDTALSALQTEVTQLVTDVTTLLDAVASGSSDDISAGVDAVTSTLQTLDGQVTAATPGTSSTPAPSSTTAPSTGSPDLDAIAAEQAAKS